MRQKINLAVVLLSSLSLQGPSHSSYNLQFCSHLEALGHCVWNTLSQSLQGQFFFPPSFRDLFQYLLWDTFPDSHLEHLPHSITLSVCLCVFLSYWRTLNLQCCVRFRCIAKWFSYAYMYLFFGFFFLIGYVYFCFYSEYFWCSEINFLLCSPDWSLSIKLHACREFFFFFFLLIHHHFTSVCNSICHIKGSL